MKRVELEVARLLMWGVCVELEFFTIRAYYSMETKQGEVESGWRISGSPNGM
jgi:hypothetical protein